MSSPVRFNPALNRSGKGHNTPIAIIELNNDTTEQRRADMATLRLTPAE